jgi:hypothetical protein
MLDTQLGTRDSGGFNLPRCSSVRAPHDGIREGCARRFS